MKDVSGHKYDSNYDFDKLKTAVRIIKGEHIKPVSMFRVSKPTYKYMVTVLQSELQSLRKKVRSQATELRDMKKSIPNHTATVLHETYLTVDHGLTLKSKITLHPNA